jgi:hypothetical protein
MSNNAETGDDNEGVRVPPPPPPSEADARRR